jgi:hypothetical protein
MPPLIDLTGKIFGKLTVIRKDPDSTPKKVYWFCECSCGNLHRVYGAELRNGGCKSCGCLKVEMGRTLNRKHGQASDGSFTGAYKTWAKMRYRTLNKNCINYNNYGGRGITIDPAWDSFEVFFSDMGPRPRGCTIERIDSNGNYEKSNCRWANNREQANNKSNNMVIEWRGATRTVSQWAALQGIPRDVLYKRIHTHKWPIEKAMTQRVRISNS